jgi:hypothetical protein
LNLWDDLPILNNRYSYRLIQEKGPPVSSTIRGSISRSMGVLALAGMLLIASSQATTLHVAPTGSDSSTGTAAAPFRTIAKAVSVLSTPGDTILLQGGMYVCPTTTTISKSGSSTARYYLLVEPGGRALLDCSSQAVNGSNRGIYLSGSYWYIRGLDIKEAGDNGMYVTGSNNIIEFCTFFGNRDTGLQLSGGAANNQVINCDSYNNADPSQGNADGFSPKLTVGTGNYFSGCRSWQNSDDGWDGYMRGADDVTTTLESCWCFSNGYLSDGSPSSGNGNGYKTGGSDTKDLRHNMVLKKCLAFDNRVKGFDQNNNRGSITIYNGTAYRNGTNYGIGDTLAPGKVLTLTNCVSFGWYGSLNAAAVQKTNSWLAPFSTVTESDFISVDTTGVRAPRKADGSLPDVAFLHLSVTSQLVNAGTDVGLPYAGNAPDLGAFETLVPAAVADENLSEPEHFALLQNYPNPFNPKTVISSQLSVASRVRLFVYDVLGRGVSVLADEYKTPGIYRIEFDGSDLCSGVYICRMTAGPFIKSIKMVLIK